VAKKKVSVDVLVSGSGTLYLVRSASKAGAEWMDEHLPEDAQTLGRAVAVEHRYIGDIVAGMQADGLVVGRA
jgi:predicted thioesterase